MADPAGESNGEVLRLDFDRRLMLQFRGSVVTSDAGLLAHRELNDALGLTTVAGEMLADARTGRNGHHALVGLFRQSVFGRLTICLRARLDDRRTKCSSSTRISAIRREAGQSRAALSPRSNGIRAKLYPRVGFIVTNMARPAENVIAFYNKRGTCEQCWCGRPPTASIVPE
jgi:hypothetical protein